jgi:cell division protein FtsQ
MADAPDTAPRAPRRRTRRAGIAAGSALLTIAVVLAALASPLFDADRVAVEGAGQLSAERVLDLAKIAEGDNVVWLDEDAAERRLEADPWVASATVSPELPNVVRIRVVERVAVGAVETHDGWLVVAADGVVLANATARPDLPAITTIVPGDDAVAAAAALLGAMPPALRHEVESLTIDADRLVHLALRGGVAVTYGDTQEGDAKAAALREVLSWAQNEGARVERVDVSVPRAPAARLEGGGLATP